MLTFRVMMLGVALLLSGWLMISPRKRSALAVVGALMITVAMVTIVQARY